MPKIHVTKSIVINKPANEIYPILNNFENWQAWSPWLIAEPQTKVTVAQDGKSYEWEGKITGAGEMQITREVDNQEIDYNLTFLKPWKSKAKTYFRLHPKGNTTEVSWIMDSSLPFFMFFMTNMMKTYIGMDYERGLQMLKDYAEDGKVHLQLDFKGATNYEGCQFVGIRTQGRASNIKELMSKDFENMMAYVYGKHMDKVVGAPFSVYHKFDPVKDKLDYTAGVPVSSIPLDIPSNMMQGQIPKFKAYSIIHAGPYRHIGNIWAAQVMHMRSKMFKAAKKPHPMEIYHNSPQDTPENELITEVLFAAK